MCWDRDGRVAGPLVQVSATGSCGRMAAAVAQQAAGLASRQLLSHPSARFCCKTCLVEAGVVLVQLVLHPLCIPDRDGATLAA